MITKFGKSDAELQMVSELEFAKIKTEGKSYF